MYELHIYLTKNAYEYHIKSTIKGGSRRAVVGKVLMMMKAAKLGWAGAGAGKKQGWNKSRARKGRSWAGLEQGRSRAEVGTGLE